MKNSEHYDLENLQKKIAEKVVKISGQIERDRLLKIVIDLGRELVEIKQNLEQDIKYPRPDIINFILPCERSNFSYRFGRKS